MPPSLDELLAGGSDFALCNLLYGRLCARHCGAPDAAKLAPEERVVALVWGAIGVVGNGGFRFLLETDVPGDPHLAHTRAAFAAVGCADALAALDATLALFPESRPPADPAERGRAYNRAIASWPTPEDRRFFDAQPELERALAAWVRANAEAFPSGPPSPEGGGG